MSSISLVVARLDPPIDKVLFSISLKTNRDYPTLQDPGRVPMTINASDALVIPAGLDNIGAGTFTVGLVLCLSCA